MAAREAVLHRELVDTRDDVVRAVTAGKRLFLIHTLRV